jgi:hypothetical protein
MVSLRHILASLAIVPAALVSVSAAPVDERCDCDKPAPKVFIISMVCMPANLKIDD